VAMKIQVIVLWVMTWCHMTVTWTWECSWKKMFVHK